VREPYVGRNFNLPGSVTQQMHMDRTFRNEFMIVNISVVDPDLVNGAPDVGSWQSQEVLQALAVGSARQGPRPTSGCHPRLVTF
jgi:hypothetical protein